jgi:hypothetical protein
MAKKLLWFALCWCLFSSCASSGFRVMAGYKRMNIGTGALGILLIKKNMQISDPEDVRQFLGGFGSPEDNYYDFFAMEFPAKMKAHTKFKRVYFARGADESALRGDSQTYDYQQDASMVVPPRRGFISDSLSYLLIIDMLSASVDRRQTAQIAGAETSFTGLGGADHLVQTASFVLWDNKAGALAAYGTLKEKIALYDPMTRNTWVETLEKLAASINRGMPYGK